jgi:hypothetical protein
VAGGRFAVLGLYIVGLNGMNSYNHDNKGGVEWGYYCRTKPSL